MPSMLDGKRTFSEAPSSEGKRKFSEGAVEMTRAVDAKSSETKSADSKSGDTTRYICLLCKRKFPDEEKLIQHAQLSEIHRRNLMQAEEQVARLKQTCRGQLFSLRQRLGEVESALEANKSKVPDDDKLKKRDKISKQIRTLEDQYGSAQEQLEKVRVINTKGLGNRRHQKTFSQPVADFMITAGVASWQGGKEVQEDRYSIHMELQGPGKESMAVYGVFDGHSGSLCSDFLTQQICPNLQKCISAKKQLNEVSLHEAITECFVFTDDEFLQTARAQELFDGSTAILAIFWTHVDGRGKGLRVTVANCGDCRAVLAQHDGGSRPKAVPLSEDHKPGRADERKRIVQAGGVVEDVQGVARCMAPGPLNVGGRSIYWGLSVSRAFGDLPLKDPSAFACMKGSQIVCSTPDIQTFPLSKNDRGIVMCCDGIYDVLSNEDVIEVAGEVESTGSAARRVVRAAYERTSEDNLTAIVMRWQSGEAGGEVPKKARTS